MAKLRYDIRRGISKTKTKITLAITAFGLLIGGGGLSLAMFGTAHAVPPNCTVGSGKDYSTIQAAVSNDACTTVTVDPGTYNENVNITHTLILNGPRSEERRVGKECRSR